MDISITTEQIFYVCSFVAAIWGVWKIVKEIKKPSEDLREKVEHHERLLNSDNERLKDVEESNKMILQCLLILINHDITGNSIDKMKECRDELQEYLINK